MRRRTRDLRGMRCAVRRPGRRPGRHRRRRIGLPRIPSGAGRPDAVVRRLPAPRKPGAAGRSAAAVGQLGDARSRTHPPLRHLLLRRSAAGRPARRRRQHRVRPGAVGDAAGRHRRIRSRPLLLAAADLDAAGLADRAHGCRRAWPSSVRSSRCNRTSKSTATTGFSSSSTPTGTTGPAKPADWGGGFERVRQRPPGAQTIRAWGRWRCRGRRPTP